MKVDLRQAVMETVEWDGVLTKETRSAWVRNFWRLHKLRGLQFSRPRIPEDAANTNLSLIAAVDAANDLKIVGVWARFERKNGEYSSQLIIGRSLLSRENSSIPREELEAAAIGSNLLWVVRNALQNWVTDDYLLLSDSLIALCWITSEHKRLSLFHRNRCNQVRMNTDLTKLYYVRSNFNPSDTGTRPDKVTENTVGPGSVWETGKDWMKGSLDDALKADIIKPAADLRMADNDEAEFDKGVILERTPEILIRGHEVDRQSKILERAEFSKYILMPTKYNFRKVVIITSLVFKFITKVCKYNKFKPTENSYKMFPASFIQPGLKVFAREGLGSDLDLNQVPGSAPASNICWGSEKAGEPDKVDTVNVVLDKDDISRALTYWFTKATNEVVKFVNPDTVKRVGVMKDGILYCRSRIYNGQRLMQAGDIDVESLGHGIGLNLATPLIERFSPIAYSIAMFIHHFVGKHSGHETCTRMSLEYCHILQAASLFRQISDQCSKCKMIRKQYLEVVMGPVSDHQLTISPCFHVTFCDLDGPYKIFVPGFERNTRNRKEIDVRAYIMTFTCPMTKLVNLQVLEAKNSEAVLEGLIRLACEVGMPSCLILDQETSFMKMVRDAEINLKDLSMRSYKEFGVKFEVAPVSGHNYIGAVERRIRTVQEAFVKIDLKNKRLHATGLQTLCKLVENDLNNTPIGYSFSRDTANTEVLKIITPNLMKIGRLHSRPLTGPLRYPSGPAEYLQKVESLYEAFYKIWNDNMLPRLIPQPKWFTDSPEIKVGDVVMFQKVVNKLSSNPWTVGQVESVTRSRDGAIRRAEIRYHVYGDDDTPKKDKVLVPHFTDRSVRSLVKLFHIEDNYFINEMAEVERMMKEIGGVEKEAGFRPGPINNPTDAAANVVLPKPTENCECCCASHCFFQHFPGATARTVLITRSSPSYPDVLHPDHDTPDDSLLDDSCLPAYDSQDPLHAILTTLETKFDLE